jgi:hypothetical protein
MDLFIRAGNKAFEMIKDRGFDFDQITTYVGPANGSKWLIASGFDLPLLKSGVLGNAKPVLLSGTSVGAWRFAAWLQPEPAKSYESLIEAYISLACAPNDNPGTVMDKMSSIINSYIDDDALPFALNNKRYRLSVITARSLLLNKSDVLWVQKLGLLLASLGNSLSPFFLNYFFERIVFYYAPLPPRFCLQKGFKGKAIPLNTINFKDALIASAAVPLRVKGIRDIYGAPNGIYRSGALFDYHLNQKYQTKENEITLLFHHQKAIAPGCFDRNNKSRWLTGPKLDNVLLIYPTRDFVRTLPKGKMPNLADFMKNPQERVENWRKVVNSSSILGDQFLELVHSSKFPEAVRKL